jgi:hypothetical protein
MSQVIWNEQTIPVARYHCHTALDTRQSKLKAISLEQVAERPKQSATFVSAQHGR